ncbi:PREDICTED: phytanoyl-CoA dioxygenase, peroxisomal-like isoform X2 [Acropora digitifera]|uniref:phytanoyl-CoA dioxygenase, peroxisomal-like isoform X2 n=1 Tax=Acropora digitifera TaxID=70779 RepID=UPI00077ACEA0|nr:PREDICTED: phytanoyl-CoA dioxygenase, peroxisomal-like isoform X2 [Acropora digitifera]
MGDRSCSRLSVISSHLNCCKSQLKTSCVRATSSFNCNDRLVVPNDFLTEEQVHFYNKNGYLVVRNLVPADMLNRFVERFHEICSGDILVPGMTVMKDVKHVKWNSPMSERTVNKLQNFEEDEVLFSYCELPQILKYVTCFTGPDAKSVHTMLINKPPDPGTKTSRHPLHQDLHYFPFRPANRIVCSWTAMEKVDKRNGCLVVLPGSHYSPLLHHHYPKWEAISGHFASSHCYYIDVKGTSQENIEAEVLEIVHKVVGEGIDLSFQEMWKMKSRLVHGSEGGDH